MDEQFPTGISRREPATNNRKYVVPCLVILLIAATWVAIGNYRELKRLKENPQVFAQEEATQLVSQVGKLIVLPDGEQPTVATVTDPDRLKDQPFFGKAKLGDKVLIYTNAKKAILYDPVNNKIVEVAPLNIGNP